MSARFELKPSTDQFMFNLIAGNGEIILTSERYKAKASAINGIESVKKNAGDQSRFEKKMSSNDKPYFVLKAGNHEIIGSSQMYASEDARDNGIQSVMKNAAEAAIDDKTA